MCWLCGVSSVCQCQWQLLCVCWADWMLVVEAGTSCCSASTEDGDPAAASHSPLPTLAGAGHQPRLHPTIHQHPYTAKHCKQCSQIIWIFSHLNCKQSELFMVPFSWKALSLALKAYTRVERCTWEFWIRFPFVVMNTKYSSITSKLLYVWISKNIQIQIILLKKNRNTKNLRGRYFYQHVVEILLMIITHPN